VWKKWGVPNEELDVNLDAISLVGMVDPMPKPMPMKGMGGEQPMGQPSMQGEMMAPMKPMGDMGMSSMPQSCGGPSLLYNGSFEKGFNPASIGHVGKGWGSYTNGGAASYGFYDDMWAPVVADGKHAQLIEINTKGIMPADGDRYAGIYQRIGKLEVGKRYELTVRGVLRGEGGEAGDAGDRRGPGPGRDREGPRRGPGAAGLRVRREGARPSARPVEHAVRPAGRGADRADSGPHGPPAAHPGEDRDRDRGPHRPALPIRLDTRSGVEAAGDRRSGGSGA